MGSSPRQGESESNVLNPTPSQAFNIFILANCCLPLAFSSWGKILQGISLIPYNSFYHAHRNMHTTECTSIYSHALTYKWPSIIVKTNFYFTPSAPAAISPRWDSQIYTGERWVITAWTNAPHLYITGFLLSSAWNPNFLKVMDTRCQLCPSLSTSSPQLYASSHLLSSISLAFLRPWNFSSDEDQMVIKAFNRAAEM